MTGGGTAASRNRTRARVWKAVLTGVAPAWRATHSTANDSLKSGRGPSSGLSTRRSRSVLVTVEIALTLALVICAGLLGRSFVRLPKPVEAEITALAVIGGDRETVMAVIGGTVMARASRCSP